MQRSFLSQIEPGLVQPSNKAPQIPGFTLSRYEPKAKKRGRMLLATLSADAQANTAKCVIYSKNDLALTPQ
jgi:hypothetical protein